MLTDNVQKHFLQVAASLLLIISGILFSGECFPNAAIKVNVNELTDHVAVYHIEGARSTNIIVIDSNEGLVVFDSELSPVFAQAIREKIEETRQGKPFRFLINTHEHGDHTYGNQVFNDATIVGHERCKAEMIKNQARARQTGTQLTNAAKSMYMKLENMDKNSDAAEEMRNVIAYYESAAAGLGEDFVLTPPEITFSDKLHLDLGNMTLTLMYIGGPAHSNSDIIIHCPEEKVLVTGDLFYEDNEPYLDSERIQYLDQYKWILETVLADTSTIHFIVPGHDKLLPLSLLVSNLEFIKQKQAEFAGKESALFAFKIVYENEGLESSIEKMRELYSDSPHYYFLHPEFDTFAYRLMLGQKLSDAIALFTVLAELYPESYIAFDSLGEAYFQLGDKAQAKKYFSRSLALNPENENARNRLAELR